MDIVTEKQMCLFRWYLDLFDIIKKIEETVPIKLFRMNRLCSDAMLYEPAKLTSLSYIEEVHSRTQC